MNLNSTPMRKKVSSPPPSTGEKRQQINLTDKIK
jgi:hypothetical protein